VLNAYDLPGGKSKGMHYWRRQALTVLIGLMMASANSLSIASSTSCGK
jgi:hypothetical protein